MPITKEYSISKTRVLSLISIGAALLTFSSFSSATKPTGPFDVKLEISRLPRLNEDVALVCSVTASIDVETALVGFMVWDTLNVRIISGQKQWEGSFKKSETKEFRLVVSFQNEGVFDLGAVAQMISRGGRSANVKSLHVKTYKDRPAEILVRKYPKPPSPWVIGKRRNYHLDSLRTQKEQKKEDQD